MENDQHRDSQGLYILGSSQTGMRDDGSRSIVGLIDPVQSSFALDLHQMCQHYIGGSTATRTRLMHMIAAHDENVLLSFSCTAAIYAIREQSTAWVKSGLLALGMISSPSDYRDVFVQLGQLHHAATRIGADADQMFREIAAISALEPSLLMINVSNRAPEEKSLHTLSGLSEIETDHGICFIRMDFHPYHPTYGLPRIILQLAELVTADGYDLSGGVTIGSSLPQVWLESDDNTQLDAALQQVVAGASISARPGEVMQASPKPQRLITLLDESLEQGVAETSSSVQSGQDRHPDPMSQLLIIFLVELESDNAAQSLLQCSQHLQRTSHGMLGLAEERLFCLVIGESWIVGVESFETNESLMRFAPGITAILQQTTHSN